MTRVLIIDDDGMIRRLLEEHLSNEGYEVMSVSMAEEGYALALASPPDLILLDVNLPDATGFQMCGRLRQNLVTHAIPIIMMTGAARWPNQQEIGKRMGANAYILKPFDVFDLSRRIDALVGSKRPVRIEPLPVTAPAPEKLDSPPRLLLTGPEVQPGPAVSEVVPNRIEFPPPAAYPDEPQEEGDQRFSDFSVEVLILVSRLPRTRAGRHTADQLLKCGTMVGARINESCLAESPDDNLRIRRAALKDLREAGYWLMLIRKSGLMETPSVESLEKKCRELSGVLAEQLLTPKQTA